jgi:NAD(P)-dependent dehydrogenase (short-subunit alcohol dehydrogenase family)/dienelactone hydrolase
MGRLDGKIALITGTAGGQGRAAALLFAREGAQVVGCDIRAEGAQQTAAMVRQAGGRMLSMGPVDLSRPEDAARWVSDAVAACGGLDILYNNASTGRVGPFATLTLESWQFTLRNELDLIYLVTRAAWPHLIARGGGSIINTGSIIASRGTDMPMSAHGSAKAGVVALTAHLALEGGPYGIRVNAISPGLIATEMFVDHLKDPFDSMQKQVRTSPLGRVGRAEDVASVALFLASEESAYMTGTNLVVDGGQSLGIGMSFGRAPQRPTAVAEAAAVPDAVRVSTLRIDTEDGVADAYVIEPQAAGPWPGILLYTDIMGVRKVFLDMAQRLAASGFVVLLPNLFYRTAPPFDPPLSVHDSAQLGQLLALAQTLDRALLERDARRYMAALREQRATAPGPLGCVGYCMSGAFAVWTAAALPGQFGAVASIHGGHLSTAAEDSPDRLAARARAHFYLACAETDPFMKPEAISQLRARLHASGTSHEVEVFPETFHGFAVADAAYDPRASELHWERLVGFLTRELKSA